MGKSLQSLRKDVSSIPIFQIFQCPFASSSKHYCPYFFTYVRPAILFTISSETAHFQHEGPLATWWPKLCCSLVKQRPPHPAAVPPHFGTARPRRGIGFWNGPAWIWGVGRPRLGQTLCDIMA